MIRQLDNLSEEELEFLERANENKKSEPDCCVKCGKEFLPGQRITPINNEGPAHESCTWADQENQEYESWMKGYNDR